MIKQSSGSARDRAEDACSELMTCSINAVPCRDSHEIIRNSQSGTSQCHTNTHCNHSSKHEPGEVTRQARRNTVFNNLPCCAEMNPTQLNIGEIMTTKCQSSWGGGGGGEGGWVQTWGGGSRAAHISDAAGGWAALPPLHQLPHGGVHAGLHIPPGPHVLRLLLTPHHLGSRILHHHLPTQPQLLKGPLLTHTPSFFKNMNPKDSMCIER